MGSVQAVAPLRFCDLGGWTDIRVVERGAVLNLAATLYTHVTVERGDDGIRLRSEDTGEEVHAAGVAELSYDGTLDLLKAG